MAAGRRQICNTKTDCAGLHDLRQLSRSRSVLGGVVQGVGFRPAVYRAAVEHSVSGWVCNSAEGVVIEAEGDPSAVNAFLRKVIHDPPAGAVVADVATVDIEACGVIGFEIRPSLAGVPVSWAPPDVATCEACLEEIRDPSNLRFRYPFTNCTHCGPRFSIIKSLPYDRENTTMHVFEQCPDCEREYTDPSDRRFHAQPNACSRCGPSVWLVDASGTTLHKRSDAISDSARRILQGEIVAVKGLGGFHLMTRAGSREAVARLRRRKHREEKPLALLCSDLAMAEQLCRIDSVAADLLISPQAPIVLLPRLTVPDHWGVLENEQIAPGAGRLGVMLAYTPLHHLLMDEIGEPIIATSGNVSDEPICIRNDEAMERLGQIADVFLLHDRDIERAVDDSVVQIVSGAAQVLRRSRGFAPLPIRIGEVAVRSRDLVGEVAVRSRDLVGEVAVRSRGGGVDRLVLLGRGTAVLAVGAHQKNTVTLLRGGDAFVGQHIGDLNTVAAIDAFEKSATDLPNLYACTPTIVARDLHPDYASSTFADKRPEATVLAQHHVAHVLSGMAEHGISETVLGVCWDGTGLGTDGTIWGGETFLVSPPAKGLSPDSKREWSGLQDVGSEDAVSAALDARPVGLANAGREVVKRVSTFRPFRLVGGDQAAREPRRSALGLWDALGRPEAGRAIIRQLFSESEWRVLLSALDRDTSTHVTTSAGRLFDGLSALVTPHSVVKFEAQAAVALEELAWLRFGLVSEEKSASASRTILPILASTNPAELDRLARAVPRLKLVASANEDTAELDRHSGAAPRLNLPTSANNTPAEFDRQSVFAPLLDLVATPNQGPTELDWGPLFFLMLKKDLPAAERALAAHIALAQSVAAIAELSPDVPVLLTGGCFQNRLLTELAERILSERGRMVYIHRRVPPNDGGISLGQAVAARWASSPDFAATNNYIRTYPAG